MARDPYTTVRPRETILDLSRRLQVPFSSILRSNPNLRYLQGGQMLRIPNVGQPGVPAIQGYNAPGPQTLGGPGGGRFGWQPRGGYTPPPFTPQPPPPPQWGDVPPPAPPPPQQWPDESRFVQPPPPQQVAPKVFQRVVPPQPPPPPPAPYTSLG